MSPQRPNLQIGDVAKLVGYPAAVLFKIAAAGNRKYRRREITSRDGKLRVLQVPDAQLMDVQRRIHQRLLRPIKVHPSVHSAVGRNALTNARVHLRHRFLSVLDIEDCFPSIGPHRVRRALERAGFPPDVARLLSRLTTVDHELPQGSPTSPRLLDLVLADFDGKVAAIARAIGLTYTRYVDDLCLSGGQRVTQVAKLIERVLRQHQLRFNVRKRRDWGPGDPHTVTGIVVNHRPNATPEYLAALRRALILLTGRGNALNPGDLAHIRGRIAYVKWINRAEGARLEKLLDRPGRRD